MTDVRTGETSRSCDGDEALVSVEDGRRMLDASARLNLNMSGEEFLAAWDEGRIPSPDSLRVQQVASMIHFAR